MMTSRIKLLYRCELAATTRKVWLWYTRRFSIDCLNPPYSWLTIEKRAMNFSKGCRSILKIRFIKGIYFHLVYEREGALIERQISDKLISGPCKKHHHEVRFLPWKETSTVLEDRLEIELTPFGRINHYLHPILEKRLDRIFRWRHHIASFNIKLLEEFPFADKVHVIGLSYKTNWLTRRLKCQLEPMPTFENDPFQLTSQYGLHAIVFNAIGYTRAELSPRTLEELRRHHAGVVICFYDQKNPAWLESLHAYGDQIIFIRVKGFLSPFYKWIPPSRQEKWSCEEDLLSMIFQILHERKGYGSWHFMHSEPIPNKLRSFIQEACKKLSQLQMPTLWQKLFLSSFQLINKALYPQPDLPLFPLKIKAFSSLKKWKETSFCP